MGAGVPEARRTARTSSVRVPVVDDQRQGGGERPGEGDLRGEDFLLPLAADGVPVVVQADLAVGGHLAGCRMIQRRHLLGRLLPPFLRRLGMDADGRVTSPPMPSGRPPAAAGPVIADAQQARHARRPRPLPHLVPILVKILVVQVAVRVYEFIMALL